MICKYLQWDRPTEVTVPVKKFELSHGVFKNDFCQEGEIVNKQQKKIKKCWTVSNVLFFSNVLGFFLIG